jgi:exodeoxyribonuclease VIII
MTWIQNLSIENYHAQRDFIGSSDLRRLLRSPAHFQTTSAFSSSAQEFGTLVHQRVLEPDDWAARCRVAPKIDRRTKEGKAIAEQLALQEQIDGIKFIAEDLFKQVELCAGSVLSSVGPTGLLAGGLAEVSGFARDFHGIDAKIRPDYMRDDLIVDLKTTHDARPDAVIRSVMNYQYHVQASYYLSVAKAIDGKSRRFVWIFVEKDAPFGVQIYEPSEAMLSNGWALFNRAIEIYRECRDLEHFPGYSTAIQKLELPRWHSEDL